MAERRLGLAKHQSGSSEGSFQISSETSRQDPRRYVVVAPFLSLCDSLFGARGRSEAPGTPTNCPVIAFLSS
jgi:hypothetical protein